MGNGGKLSQTSGCITSACDVVSVTWHQLLKTPFIYAEPAILTLASVRSNDDDEIFITELQT